MKEDDTKLTLRMLSIAGITFLITQSVEKALAFTLNTTLKDRHLTPSSLSAQDEKQQFKSLRDLVHEMKKRSKLDPEFKDRLYRFWWMRNKFVPDFSGIQGWDFRTEEGREVATEFMAQLLSDGLYINAVCIALLQVSAKDEFGVDFFEDESDDLRALVAAFERVQGPVARKILAGRFRSE